MNDCVENDPSLLEFHDSFFSLIGYDGTDLTLQAGLVADGSNTIRLSPVIREQG